MKRSIRSKIQSAFGVMIWLAVAVAATGVMALFAVRHSANQAMNRGAKLNQIGLEIQVQNLTARRYEKDFLLNIKTEGVENAKRNQASKVTAAVTQLEQLAGQGGRIAMDPVDLERFQNIDKLARSYATAFASVVAAKERRGHVDSGAEGQFRTAAHEIEGQLKNLDKIQIAMLTMRRSEKDYLLRGDEKYISATLENVKKLKAAVDRAPLSAVEKTSAKKAADTYREAFLILIDADREVAAKTVIYREANRRLEGAAEDVARAGQRAGEESLDSASMTAVVAIIVVVLISLGAISAGMRYGSRISTNIVHPVKHLTEVAEHVSMGDLSLNVGHTADDEIGDLEDSLARLVTAVKFFKAESQEATASTGHKVKQ
jgi:HAMP domain-containing protein